MEPSDWEALINQCPWLLRLNDGRKYLVEKPEFITVGDYTASILYNDNGVERHAVVGLINISAVLPQEPVG
jgi:hypothetical protein